MNSYEAFWRKLLRDAGAFQNIARTGELFRQMSDRMTQPMIANIGRQLEGASFGLGKFAAGLQVNVAQLAIGDALRNSAAFKIPQMFRMPTPVALLRLQESVTSIAKSIDFGKLIDAAKLAETMHKAMIRALPPNWPDNANLIDVVELLEETGLPIVWVPRADVVAALLDASDAETRDRLLLDREDEILEDVRHVLGEIEDEELRGIAECATQGVACFTDGHHGPTQAWAATILTTVLQGTLQYASLAEARRKMSMNWEEQSLRRLRLALVAMSVRHALAEFWPHKGDPVPARFNRHASALWLSPEQFTRLNALISLMTVTSLIRELEQLLRDGDVSHTDAA